MHRNKPNTSQQIMAYLHAQQSLQLDEHQISGNNQILGNKKADPTDQSVSALQTKATNRFRVNRFNQPAQGVGQYASL